MKKQYETFSIDLKAVDTEKFTLDAIFSTPDRDRHGEIVKQNWDLKSYKKNPVILDSHNYREADHVIGKAEKIAVKEGKLQGKIRFAVEENPRAKTIFDLFAGGFLNAFSVGFIPLEFNDKGEVLKSELLEVSAVSVPANALALAKAKGIDVSSLMEDEEDEDENEDENEEEESEAEDVEEVEEEADGEDLETLLEDEPDDEVLEISDKEFKLLLAHRKRQKLLSLINQAVKQIGELPKVETRSQSVIAKREFNRAIRKLIQNKKCL